MNLTHYVPPFTTRRSGVQMTACGVFVQAREHAVEPTCPKCHAWLEADEAEAKQLAAKWAAEDEVHHDDRR